jgi:hypothetical protein
MSDKKKRGRNEDSIKKENIDKLIAYLEFSKKEQKGNGNK